MFDIRLDRIKQLNGSYWATRILTQLEYAHELSLIAKGEHDAIIDQVTAFLAINCEEDGVLTNAAARQAESQLAPLTVQAKQFTMICAAHAHIDMNWMWRWDETVAVTLDTFRTMLALMREYPDFKFSQSQASVYQIVETYDPEMLAEIRARVKEGRWEVTASTWVEADKNMPNGESQARHMLYTRQYLSRLLGLEPDAFRLDFEPDTFGHHANVPEILASGGVKYYYHCRGDQDSALYRWESPSGASILVYREPLWYLGYIEPAMALYVPSFCSQYGMDTMLKVYGVGDHGGGPTRRDVERIADMAAWPVFPKITFGTFEEYFKCVEKAAGHLPVKTGELNMVFTGCYTSQSRIKRANRLAEAALNSAETFCSFAALDGKVYPGQAFATAWQNTLFNQFHDIIPGSGVIDTREYALGLFQQTLALANSSKTLAFQTLTSLFKPSALPSKKPDDLAASIAEGAGVGYGIEDFRISQVSRAGGKERLFTIFNSAPWPRTQVVEAVVWDWNGDIQRLVFRDSQGGLLRFQVLDRGLNNYWGHAFLRVLLEVNAPACGYSTVVLQESDLVLNTLSFPLDPRVETPEELLLENEHLRARFDPRTCALVSLIDKASGLALVSPERPAIFRQILEDERVMGTAWVVGRYLEVRSLNENVHLLKNDVSGKLRQSITYEAVSGASKLNVTVALDAGSRSLDVSVDCDWQEIGHKGVGVPQLNFWLPAAYPCRAYRYDIPSGFIDRESQSLDVPANSWGAALAEDSGRPGLQMITDSTYGFRGVDDSLALTLIRSSMDPDPYPELGNHKIHFAIRACDLGSENKDLAAAAFNATHALDVFSSTGSPVSAHSFLALESGHAVIQSVKVPEEGQSGELVIRLYETEGQPAQVQLQFDRKITQAAWVDVYEQPVISTQPLQVEGRLLRLTLDAYRVAAVRLQLTASS